MSSIDPQPVTTSAAWRGDELGAGSEWIYRLGTDQVAELEQLGQRFVADDPDLRYVQAADYPLAACADGLAQWAADVDSGRGFVLVRGLRTELYSDALSAAIYYILGLHLGEPMHQNNLGDLVDHVYATSDKTMDDPTALSARVRDVLPFHSDSSDLVALMCLRPARIGGASCLVSGAEIYNEILRRRPDLAPLLFEPLHWDWYRQDHNAPARTYTSPIVSITDGVFSIYAGALYVKTAQDYPEVPRLRPEQLELLDLFDEIAMEPGMAVEMDFRPGDIQWLSNYAALHSRASFVDWPEPQRRRHLLRLWLRREGGRPIAPGFGKNAVVTGRDRTDINPDDDRNGDNFRIGTAAVPRLGS
ncbi:MAG: TauD/TfdA family dioxygenase [Ilumatobacteraceae bacterium]|nr:TauD/TfdA family dioxygenase [Ilumatobacteraceae bacterium]